MAVWPQIISTPLMFVLLCSALLATTLQGVQGQVEVEGPSESECRPYIEKALKKLETGDTLSAAVQEDTSIEVPEDDSDNKSEDEIEIIHTDTSGVNEQIENASVEDEQTDSQESVEETIGSVETETDAADDETGETAEDEDTTDSETESTEAQVEADKEKTSEENITETTAENEDEEDGDDDDNENKMSAEIDSDDNEDANVEEASVEKESSIEEAADDEESKEEQGSVEQEKDQVKAEILEQEEEETKTESLEEEDGKKESEEQDENKKESIEQGEEDDDEKKNSLEQEDDDEEVVEKASVEQEEEEANKESVEQDASVQQEDSDEQATSAADKEDTDEQDDTAEQDTSVEKDDSVEEDNTAEQDKSVENYDTDEQDNTAEQTTDTTEVETSTEVNEEQQSVEETTIIEEEASVEQTVESVSEASVEKLGSGEETSTENKSDDNNDQDETAASTEEVNTENNSSEKETDTDTEASNEEETSTNAQEKQTSAEQEDSLHDENNSQEQSSTETGEQTQSGEELQADEGQSKEENDVKSAENVIADSADEEQEKDNANTEEEESKEGEAERESTPEEDLSWEFDVPTDLRPRDQLNEILQLDGAPSNIGNMLSKAADVTLNELKRLYENAIKPLEVLYKYRDLSNRHFGDSEIFSKPLILFMGPWSGGKSSIINYLLDNEFKHTSLRTGAEPSPAYFNILMHGEEPEVLDGTQLAADWTFSGLQKFGQGLEERLRGLKYPSKLLEKINIVEIPGILEVRKQVARVFPFNDACQWFIDRADIIFLVYDPSKLDVGPETEAILDQLKGREYQTRIILNKADQVKPEELMRVQGALIWNISPLMSSAQPPVMYTTSLWSKPYEVGAPIRLLQAQEKGFLKDLKVAVDKRIENKIASARRFAVRVRNHAKMVDCYLTTYYNHKSVFGNKKLVADQITEHPQNYHIYEGLSTLTNISRYDLPDPDVYRDFFKLNPLYDFQQLSATCTYFRGCPINRLDVAIAYDLPELVGKYKKMVEAAVASAPESTTKS